jgi:hypothetical protein
MSGNKGVLNTEMENRLKVYLYLKKQQLTLSEIEFLTQSSEWMPKVFQDCVNSIQTKPSS